MIFKSCYPEILVKVVGTKYQCTVSLGQAIKSYDGFSVSFHFLCEQSRINSVFLACLKKEFPVFINQKLVTIRLDTLDPKFQYTVLK